MQTQSAAVVSGTQTQVIAAETSLPISSLQVKKAKKDVKWEEGTIDNEHLGRKSSKSRRNKKNFICYGLTHSCVE